MANELDISVHKLSSTIKLFSEKNFNDYINDFRIALAKELLIHKDYKNYTITSIGLESGFNSKSTFYATFKKTHRFYTKSISKEVFNFRRVKLSRIL